MTVLLSIFNSPAICRYDCPASINFITLGASLSDFGRKPFWRPRIWPLALAAARPDLLPFPAAGRSNSARLASTPASSLPWGVLKSSCSPETASIDTFQL